MKRIVSLIPIVLLIGLAFLFSSCGISDAEIAQTEAAFNQTAAAQSTGTMSIQHTSAAATQVMGTMLAETEQAAAATQSAQETKNADRATRQAAAEQTLVAGTEVAIAESTESASEIYSVVQDLYDGGYISTTEGSFQQLPSFDDSWAQIGWYFTSPIRNSEVSDFVLLVDVSWETAQRGAEIKYSGCGISFRMSDDGAEYYTFMMTLDGNMSFFSKISGYSPYLSKAYFGPVDYMEDSTTFILAVEGSSLQVFNEDLKRIDLRTGSSLSSGGLAYLLSSGINTDFGTRCNFTDTDLWRIGE